MISLIKIHKIIYNFKEKQKFGKMERQQLVLMVFYVLIFPLVDINIEINASQL